MFFFNFIEILNNDFLIQSKLYAIVCVDCENPLCSFGYRHKPFPNDRYQIWCNISDQFIFAPVEVDFLIDSLKVGRARKPSICIVRGIKSSLDEEKRA